MDTTTQGRQPGFATGLSLLLPITLSAMALDEAGYVTGADIRVDGGATA